MCTLASESFCLELLNQGNFIPIAAITLGCLTGMVAIIGGAVSSVMRTRAKEQTKRELAAYVAEGSITPDDAVAMVNAGQSKVDAKGGGCCT